MSDVASVPVDRLADLERIADAAEAWLRAWQASQSNQNTVAAFEYSKKLAAVVRSVNG